MIVEAAGLRLALLTGALLGLSGCGFSPPMSPGDRATLQACRSEADRVYDVQNRAQISQRGDQDTPFSSETPRGLPSDGLADRYSHERTVDDCVRHGTGTQTTP